MKNLIASTQGRLLALAMGIAIGGTGLSTLVQGHGLIISSVSVLLAAAVMIVGLALSVEAHFGAAAIVIIVLPFATNLGELGAQLATRAYGWPLLLVALPFIAFAARARTAERAPELQLSRTRS